MSHQENLSHVCRLCGLKSLNLKAFKWSRNKSLFYSLIKENEENEDLSSKHDTYCQNCIRDLLKPLNTSCRKNRIDEVVEDIKDKIYSFPPHSGECKVCSQFSHENNDDVATTSEDRNVQFHKKALNCICTICGLKSTPVWKFSKFSKFRDRNVDLLRDLMTMNRRDTELLPAPNQICYQCRRSVVKPLTKQFHSEEEKETAKTTFISKLYYFKDHSSNCPICVQFSPEDFDEDNINNQPNLEDHEETDLSSSDNETHDNNEDESTQESDPGPGMQMSNSDSGQRFEHESETESEVDQQVLATFEMHIEALNQICSLCGTRTKKYLMRQFIFKRNGEAFHELLSNARNMLIPSPKKDKFCKRCITLLSNFDTKIKERKEFEELEDKITERLHIFKQHTPIDCQICSQFGNNELQQLLRKPGIPQQEDHSDSDDEEQELMDLMSNSGDNSGNEDSLLDDAQYGRQSSASGYQTPSKRDRSTLSDSSTDDCEPTPKMSTPRRRNMEQTFVDSPTRYDKVTCTLFKS